MTYTSGFSWYLGTNKVGTNVTDHASFHLKKPTSGFISRHPNLWTAFCLFIILPLFRARGVHGLKLWRSLSRSLSVSRPMSSHQKSANRR